MPPSKSALARAEKRAAREAERAARKAAEAAAAWGAGAGAAAERRAGRWDAGPRAQHAPGDRPWRWEVPQGGREGRARGNGATVRRKGGPTHGEQKVAPK